MKKSIVILAALICFLATNAMAQKIGYLNTADLLVQMPEVKKADSLLAQHAEEMQKQYGSYVTEYQQKLSDYQQNSPGWSDVKKEAAEEDLGKLQTRISEYEQQSQQKLEEKKQELYGPILDKVKTIIKEVGAENKFTAVMDGATLLYVGTDAVDILPLVKKKLNMQ